MIKNILVFLLLVFCTACAKGNYRYIPMPTITPQAFYKPVPIPKEESTVKFYRDNLGNSGTIRTMGNTIYIRRNNFK
jgi:hypothetical protein